MTRDDITAETVEILLEASMEAYAGQLADALGNAASGPDRIWDWLDFRPSEVESSGRIIDEEMRRIHPALLELLRDAATAAMLRIAVELPTAPMRCEPVDVIAEEVRLRRVPPTLVA